MLNFQVLVCVSLLSCALADFNLTIVHLNDFHARFEQTNTNSGTCSDQEANEGKCFGGIARIYSKVKELRETMPNVIVLNGGDNFQGTLWYTVYKWNVTSTFMNLLNHTAMAIGNHEFDDKIKGIAPYLEEINCPIVAANIDDTLETSFQNKYKKSIVTEVAGKKIGIVGYMAKDTKTLSNPENLIFLDEIPAITTEVENLKQQGVDIIIGLGHSGIEVDKNIAATIPDIDVVVGAHSHTFLYTGTQPSIEIPYDVYPVVVTQNDTGKKVPVVQAYAFSKYLGLLSVIFDDAGNVKSWNGSPILLDNSVPQDPYVLSLLEPWKQGIDQIGNEVIGSSKVLLDVDNGACRTGECNFGSFLTDAMVDSFVQSAEPGSWSFAPIAIYNSGGIRNSIEEKDEITFGDLATTSPFQNTIDTVELEGTYVIDMFEHAVSRPGEGQKDFFGFLQVSGVHVTYNISQPVGKRVKHLKLRCGQCRVPKYEDINPNAMYRIALNSFLVTGGDGYAMIGENMKNHTAGGLDTDIFVAYVKKQSPITQGIEGRIVVLAANETTDGTPDSNNSNESNNIKVSILPIVLFFNTLRLIS